MISNIVNSKRHVDFYILSYVSTAHYSKMIKIHNISVKWRTNYNDVTFMRRSMTLTSSKVLQLLWIIFNFLKYVLLRTFFLLFRSSWTPPAPATQIFADLLSHVWTGDKITREHRRASCLPQKQRGNYPGTNQSVWLSRMTNVALTSFHSSDHAWMERSVVNALTPPVTPPENWHAKSQKVPSFVWCYARFGNLQIQYLHLKEGSWGPFNSSL